MGQRKSMSLMKKRWGHSRRQNTYRQWERICYVCVNLLFSFFLQLRSHLQHSLPSSPQTLPTPPLPSSPPPPPLLQEAEGWQICSEVHFATWRPTASLGQPIRGCEKQPPALPLVHRSQELIPLSMAMSLCRLAVLKPIILPPFFVQTSFLQQHPLYACKGIDTHIHTHIQISPHSECHNKTLRESGNQKDLILIVMRHHYGSHHNPSYSLSRTLTTTHPQS